MVRKKIYNPQSEEKTSDRKIFGGNPTGIFELNDIKYQWAYNLWEMMLNNSWYPKEVDMTRDVNDYKHLTSAEKDAYDKVLAQLIFMDSLQTNNIIDNLNPFITAPEVNLILVRQAFEEALHSQSYAVMVDSISINTDEIYDMWKSDIELLRKNSFIGDVYEKFGEKAQDDDEAKLYMLVANQCLEGIYFYSGFSAMYALARSGKMLGSAQMIRFIQRDEVTHLTLYSNIIKEIKKEYPHLFNDRIIQNIREMYRQAYELERNWGWYVTEDQILGLNQQIIDQYVKYLTDKRLKAIGLEPIFGADNPIKWVDSFSTFNDQKTNFFEGNVTNYSKGSISFDDF